MKTALITGATSGIGREIAKSLSQKRWRVLIHGRDPKKVRLTCTQCGENATPLVADLSRVSETRNLASEVRSRLPNIDAIVLNAGTVTKRRELTPDGIERTFAVNHLAPFILVKDLYPIIQPGGQIVNISTEAHRWIQSLDLDNLQAEKRFRVLKHYAATKSANLLTTFEWAQKLHGGGIRVTSHHPGEVATDFGLHGPLWLRLFWKFSKRRFISPARAAETLVGFMTRNDTVEDTSYYFSKGTANQPAPFILDADLRNKVWDLTNGILEKISD